MVWWPRSSRLRRVGLTLITAGLVVLAVLLPVRACCSANGELDDIVGWADILAFSIGTLGAALALTGRAHASSRPSSQTLDEAADRLMRQVRNLESLQRARLLSTGPTDTTAANLRYHQVTRYHQATGLVRFRRADATAESTTDAAGTLESIGWYYTERTRRRLVILGGPGSGKTVLALELLIQLLDQRSLVTDPRRRATRPVPVRFSLPAWKTDRPLTAWLASEVSARFGMPDTLARALVEDYRILPILDGLDEMDAPTAPPVRAAAAVSQLNTYLRGRTGAPVVVTCRAEDYERLRRSARIVIRPAVEITIQPLTTDQIRDYLNDEYDSSIDWVCRQQWDPILERVDDLADQRLLAALQTPWQLTLAVAYHRDGGDLHALLPTTEESPLVAADPPHRRDRTDKNDPYLRRVATLLLSAFIPARTRLHQPGRYDPDEVTAWCRTTAKYLAGRVDIVPHEWWPIAGAERVRRWHLVAATVITGTIGLLTSITAFGGLEGVGRIIGTAVRAPSSGADLRSTAIAYVRLAWLTFVVLGFPCLAMRQACKPNTAPTQTNPQQLRTRRGRLQFVRWLAVGLAAGLAPGLAYGLSGGGAGGLGSGLGFGLAGGLAFGVACGLRPIGEVTTDPRDPLRNDLTIWLTVGIAGGATYGLVDGLADGLTTGFTTSSLVERLVAGLAFGLGGGLATALAGGLAVGLAGHAWLRYTVAMILMARRRHLPRRYGRFLNWAYQAGILRIAGNAYQFRHVELRNFLRG